jgi:hypothetical protein
MMDAVHRFEGTVNQVLGDGIMALFGAPIAHEDHALRACYAALAMQAAMRTYTEEVRRTRGLELRMRVGLNSGEVVVRAIGNDLHMDYSAVGETTVLAARMEQTATPGSIRLTPATRFCQLVETETRIRRTGIPLWFYLALGGPLCARHLSPTLESFPHLLAVIGRSQQMPSRSEVLGDGSIRRQKTLGMPRRFEALHAPLALPRRPMRVFTPVIEVATLTMFDPRQNLALCGAVAL